MTHPKDEFRFLSYANYFICVNLVFIRVDPRSNVVIRMIPSEVYHFLERHYELSWFFQMKVKILLFLKLFEMTMKANFGIVLNGMQ